MGKKDMKMRIESLKGLLKMGLVCVVVATASQAWASFSLGDAANYAVIFQGGGGNRLNINNGAGLNHSAVDGNIGIAGTGSLQLSGPLTINGNVDFAGTYVQGTSDNGPYSGGITVNGVISGGHANVQTDLTGLSGLNSLSTTLGSEAGTSIKIGTGTGYTLTVDASAGTVDTSGNSVFTVTALNLSNGTLTIKGDGTHSIVLDIGFSVNIHPNQIVLTGRLTSDQVLFNLYGGNSATLAGGPALDLNSNGGTLTAHSSTRLARSQWTAPFSTAASLVVTVTMNKPSLVLTSSLR
jgi:hypothetical protein